MSNDEDGSDAARVRALRSRRRLESWAATWSSLAAGQLMAACFAVGATLGPRPLLPRELSLVTVLGAVLGLLLSRFVRAYRQERGAVLAVDVRERNKKRRLVVFSEYFVIDDEIILRSSVESFAVDGGMLVLRYRDVLRHGAVSREFVADAGQLEGIREVLAAAA